MVGLGATIRELSIPAHRTGIAIGFASFLEGVTAIIAGYGNGYHWSGRYAPDFAMALGRGLAAWSDELPPQIKVSLLVGTFLREYYFSSFYAKAQNLRPKMRQAYDDALADVDVLIMPTATKRAQPYSPNLSLSQRVLEGWSMLGNTTPFNMTGHPSLSMPAAEADGLPVGLMLTGRLFDDGKLLALARTYERAFGWLPTGSK
jgi:amidase